VQPLGLSGRTIGALADVSDIRVDLYGSLAATEGRARDHASRAAGCAMEIRALMPLGRQSRQDHDRDRRMPKDLRSSCAEEDLGHWASSTRSQ
jgi:hypothetical protein